MIEKLEMHLPNYEVHINNNEILINGKKIRINDEDIRNIIRIIRMWKTNYEDDNNIEKEKYYIFLKTAKEESYISFIASFPDDFGHLIDYLGDLYVRKQA